MSLEKEERRSSDEGAGDFDVVLKKPKIAYAKEFLLSFSNLDICKKLPNDFNESLLSEFEDAIRSSLDRPRIPGSLPLQGFRRNEYGSSPPTRGDSSNYTRSSYGRWENRSSGRSDRDSDSQSDLDSDSGRYSIQHRRSWQNTEKDGLLGSGSFSRPPGYAAGTSASKARTTDSYQLSKSNQPYQPPRPYKAAPYSKRETDAYNDETFGSTECTNEDRAEEERRRRASFELIRKEQQKALQEKQKLNLGKNISADISSLSGELFVKNDGQGHIAHTSELDVSSGTPASNHDFDKSLPSHTLASRPRVPPGFKSNSLEKNTAVGPPTHHLILEEGNHVKGEKLLDPKIDLLQNANVDGLEQSLSQEISSVKGQPSEETSLLDKLENVKSHKSSDSPIRNSGVEDHLHSASSLLGSHGTSDDTGMIEFDAVGLENKTEANDNRSISTSILEKIFGSSLSMNDDVSSPAKHLDSKHEDTWSPNSVQLSKFAQWFVEEEAKPVDPIPSQGQNDLLSLIVSGDKGKHQVSECEASKELLYDFTSNTLEHTESPMPDFPSMANGVAHQAFTKDKENVATVLTCEDLEQSILTEYNAKTGNSRPLLEGWSTADSNTGQPSERIDDHASLNLLSLLQKGTFQSTMPVNGSVGVDSEHNFGTSVNEHEVEEGSKSIPNPGKTITLEALFGSAFMQELQSVDGPVSVQRGSIGPTVVDTLDSHGLHFPVADNNSLSSAVNRNGHQGSNYDPWAMAPNPQQPTQLGKAENWLLYDDFEIGTTSSKHHIDEVSKLGGLKGDAELQLSAMNDDASYHLMTNFMVPQNSVNLNFASNTPINAVTEERVMIGSESLRFPQNIDPKLLYRGLHGQQPSPQFQPPQMAQMRPSHDTMDSHVGHISSQMKFLGPDSMFSYDSATNPRFPSPMIQRPFHHQNIGNSGFNVPSHPPILHQMQMSGNPPHVLPDLPRGDTTSNPGNRMSGFFQEMNQMQGFPMESRQHNIAGHGFPIPGGPNMNSGNNPPPEAFQRLIEMELHSKQMQGAHGRELDMGFHYR